MQVVGVLEMFEQNVTLLLHGGIKFSWIGIGVCHQRAGLLKDPRIADTAASNADDIDAGLVDHAEDVVGIPDIA